MLRKRVGEKIEQCHRIHAGHRCSHGARGAGFGVLLRVKVRLLEDDDMDEKTSGGKKAMRYLVASIVCLIVGIRFSAMGDNIGTAIYSAGTLSLASAAVVRYLKRE